MMLGVADFSWKDAFSTILPGAICDNLTSCGGMLADGSSQTPLTELLRYGAAGSSGTVVEPFAMMQKFPTPQIHVHYARGCSLAEAFYQSVSCPFQLLIVGDPLCRPWAKIPQLELVGLKPNMMGARSRRVGPAAWATSRSIVSSGMSMICDWRPRRSTASWSWTPHSIPTATSNCAWSASRPCRSSRRAGSSCPVRINNNRRRVDLTCSAKGTANWFEPITLSAEAPDAQKIVFLQGTQSLGTVNGKEGEVEVHPEELGLGPVTLTARAI